MFHRGDYKPNDKTPRRAGGPLSSKVLVTIGFDVPDRDTGRLMSIRFQQTIEARHFTHPDPLCWSCILRGCITAAMQHEVDEMIHLDGVRVFDPHAGETPRTKTPVPAGKHPKRG